MIFRFSRKYTFFRKCLFSQKKAPAGTCSRGTRILKKLSSNPIHPSIQSIFLFSSFPFSFFPLFLFSSFPFVFFFYDFCSIHPFILPSILPSMNKSRHVSTKNCLHFCRRVWHEKVRKCVKKKCLHFWGGGWHEKVRKCVKT